MLTGGGTVSGFTQDSPTRWTVHITGMTPNGTLALTLGAASVQDYSAIDNDVHVLGENTVRYAVDTPAAAAAGTTTANGTLAKTGFDSETLYSSLFMLILGLGLTIVSKKKLASVK